ncbi:MAG: hypothetical protein DWQ37_03625 [Planctomycetota bacterium]|nr:MAG: hypothetical protein DWQ37_03625 [Planctomycetota bacterium]
MNREPLLRTLLWLATVFNTVAAYVFAFPASSLGELAGMPADAPPLYRAATALFVELFGLAYAWLAYHRPLIRPMVAFGALGKASAFVLVAVLWLTGHASPSLVALGTGDLLFAALFAWCLLGLSPTEP